MSENKLEFYDFATRELIQCATKDYPNVMVGQYSLPYAVAALRKTYKHALTYKKVFGIDDFKLFYPTKSDPAQDFCIVTSYYLYLRSGGSAVWSIKQNTVHAWLQAHDNCEPFDITYTQFVKPYQRSNMNYGKFIHTFPYDKGQIDNRLNTNPDSVAHIVEAAITLGKCAGLE